MYKQGIRFSSVLQIHRLVYLLGDSYMILLWHNYKTVEVERSEIMYYYYIVFLAKSSYSTV